MSTVGWITTTSLACIVAVALGYWCGHKCGRQDYEDGVREQ
jgi:hypothetical protein